MSLFKRTLSFHHAQRTRTHNPSNLAINAKTKRITRPSRRKLNVPNLKTTRLQRRRAIKKICPSQKNHRSQYSQRPTAFSSAVSHDFFKLKAKFHDRHILVVEPATIEDVKGITKKQRKSELEDRAEKLRGMIFSSKKFSKHFDTDNYRLGS